MIDPHGLRQNYFVHPHPDLRSDVCCRIVRISFKRAPKRILNVLINVLMGMALRLFQSGVLRSKKTTTIPMRSSDSSAGVYSVNNHQDGAALVEAHSTRSGLLKDSRSRPVSYSSIPKPVISTRAHKASISSLSYKCCPLKCA
ncbi:hypothetical protein PGT21_003039 [Puccinia graminis f. sp. tritici]|uniref:Uncharacterized protein n=1 Tax=Puccinia graminis f. sp. tritici TaxID=56615 RepID=A0A5B0LNN7_PUCGR|nr:hypothetical protein PGT21_003039 [Puccinia graminis f. sp. tritici]